MGSEWEDSTLGDISSDVSYGYTESASDEKVGPRFLRITDIQNGIVNWSAVPYCPISETDHKKYLLKDGDIVVARTGNSTGENYMYRGNEDAVFASYLIRFRLNERKACPAFIWYNLRSSRWWNFINSAKTGSAQAGANAKVLGCFPLKLPPLPEQKAIASILGALDDKIELNRKMNATLEATARALFQSWFVDFDPVRAKLDGRKFVGLDAETAEFFPDHFYNSDDVLRPNGWQLKSVYDCAIFINGVAFRDVQFSGDGVGLPVVKIAELKNGISKQTKFTREELASKYKIKDGEILFSWSGSPDTSIDTFIWAEGNGWLNQHIFKIDFYQPEQKLFVYYLLKHLKSTFIEIARDKQTTGLGHVTMQDLKRLKIVFPTLSILQAFQTLVEPIFQRFFTTLTESRTLATLRDTLLPKLLSGELRDQCKAEYKGDTS